MKLADAPDKAHDALIELAGEFGLGDVTNPDTIRRLILYADAEKESRIRQLESRIDVAERHRIPHLEEEIRQANTEATHWQTRARALEQTVPNFRRTTRAMLWIGLGLLAVGVAASAAIAITFGR